MIESSPNQIHSPISMIKGIRSGSLSASALAPEERRACVEHLVIEGYSTAEVAEALGVSDRTITRDRVAIRENNSVKADPKLVEATVGHLLGQREASVVRLRRISRDGACPHAEQIAAECAAWRVEKETIELLQRLGYLPMAAAEVRADLVHHVAVPGMAALRAEADRIEGIERATAPRPIVSEQESNDAQSSHSLHDLTSLLALGQGSEQGSEGGSDVHDAT